MWNCISDFMHKRIELTCTRHLLSLVWYATAIISNGNKWRVRRLGVMYIMRSRHYTILMVTIGRRRLTANKLSKLYTFQCRNKVHWYEAVLRVPQRKVIDFEGIPWGLHLLIFIPAKFTLVIHVIHKIWSDALYIHGEPLWVTVRRNACNHRKAKQTEHRETCMYNYIDVSVSIYSLLYVSKSHLSKNHRSSCSHNWFNRIPRQCGQFSEGAKRDPRDPRDIITINATESIRKNRSVSFIDANSVHMEWTIII